MAAISLFSSAKTASFVKNFPAKETLITCLVVTTLVVAIAAWAAWGQNSLQGLLQEGTWAAPAIFPASSAILLPAICLPVVCFAAIAAWLHLRSEPLVPPATAPHLVPLAVIPHIALTAPMPGVVTMFVQVGQTVPLNAPIAKLEVMKMETIILAPQAGTVSAVFVQNGQTLESGQQLMTIKPS